MQSLDALIQSVFRYVSEPRQKGEKNSKFLPWQVCGVKVSVLFPIFELL